MKFNIALIKGDGIGPEIVESAVFVLDKVAAKFSHNFIYNEVDAGGVSIDKHGEPLTKQAIADCKASDSVILGAVGGAQDSAWNKLPGHMRPERALLSLRSELELYANLRPAMLYKSLKDASPLRSDIIEKGFDIMIVRELTGGIYFGERGRDENNGNEHAWDTEKYSVSEIRRIAKKAFETAIQRRKKVTSVDKANVLESSRLWREVVIEEAKNYPQVLLDHMYVDNAAMQLVREPSYFDVILTSNMFGDILSDEASQITGSIGMLASASLSKTTLGIYEPIHGSAPDIAGKNIANPIATILSAAQMLKYSFKLEDEFKSIENAVNKALEAGYRTTDIMSEGMMRVGTKEMTKLIAEQI